MNDSNFPVAYLSPEKKLRSREKKVESKVAKVGEIFSR